MILLIDVLVIAVLAIFGWGAMTFIAKMPAKELTAKERARELKKRKGQYVPPIQRPGEPDVHIRTHGLAIFWHEIGAPTELGTQVEVNMKSGRTAIYELRNVEPAHGVDWSWYDLEFVRYGDTTESSADSPVRASES